MADSEEIAPATQRTRSDFRLRAVAAFGVAWFGAMTAGKLIDLSGDYSSPRLLSDVLSIAVMGTVTVYLALRAVSKADRLQAWGAELQGPASTRRAILGLTVAVVTILVLNLAPAPYDDIVVVTVITICLILMALSRLRRRSII